MGVVKQKPMADLTRISTRLSRHPGWVPALGGHHVMQGAAHSSTSVFTSRWLRSEMPLFRRDHPTSNKACSVYATHLSTPMKKPSNYQIPARRRTIVATHPSRTIN